MSDPVLPFVGSSEALARFTEDLRRAAASEATVLFLGESGAGKGAAARALHAGGRRSDGPFVSTSLIALSPTLIEAALFGHERGAFTDAHRARPGLFQKADAGTLVLDDVDLLPLEVQVKLLRALQERSVEPLGGEAPVPVDVRVVATTGRDLRDLVEAGTFREDLYYRLAVVSLEVPPLRLRVDDLEALVPLLIERVARRDGVHPRPASPEAFARLRAHSWPGNLRELENAIERVLVLGRDNVATGARIEVDELVFLAEVHAGSAEEIARQALGHGLTVDDLTQALMARALKEQRGNVSAAARQVGMTRRAFDYRHGRAPEAAAEKEA